MSQLRQKMIRAIDLKNLSDHTKRAYLNAVTGLARYYKVSPEKITAEQIDDYLLYLKNQKGYAPSSCHSVLTGLRFFYQNILDKELSVNFSPGNKRRKLPTVLSKAQVSKIIDIPKNPKHRLLLMTTYAAGLRASEVKQLKPEHINSERMLIKVENGKGRKDRYTMLSVRLLAELRDYYRECRPRTYLFPSAFKNSGTNPCLTKRYGVSMKQPVKKRVLNVGPGCTLCDTASRPIFWRPATISVKYRS